MVVGWELRLERHQVGPWEGRCLEEGLRAAARKVVLEPPEEERRNYPAGELRSSPEARTGWVVATFAEPIGRTG